jgi:hypothetical protein
MDTKQHNLQTKTRILDSRIWWLNLEERIAGRRCDWSAATDIVLERAPLKEIRQRTASSGWSRT